MKSFSHWIAALLIYGSSLSLANAVPFEGRWAFKLPNGYPVWLKVDRAENAYSGAMLWCVGKAQIIPEMRLHEKVLYFSKKRKWHPEDFRKAEPMLLNYALARGENGLWMSVSFDMDGERQAMVLHGKRMPPMPSAPDLDALRFGDGIDLLAEGMAGWRLTNPEQKNGWRIEGDELINETPKKDFSGYGEYGNLRTNREFEDFKLSIEYNVPENGNSGIYLRGMYEAQVVDRHSRMQGINGPGAIFSRIEPSHNAGKPGGEWNRYELTLVDRHITVELNGEVVIHNEALEGCTGGGISADDTVPGPILLQGDHTSVRYRNILLYPLKREVKKAIRGARGRLR